MQTSFRQYRSEAASHSHDDFHQIIIADLGMLELEIEGRGGCVSGRKLAFVPAGDTHAYRAVGMNRFLVLDVDTEVAAQTGLERLWHQAGASPYLEVVAGYAGHLTGLLQGLEQKRAISRIRRIAPDGQGNLQSENLSLLHMAGIATCESAFADDAFICQTLREVLGHSAAAQGRDTDFGQGIPMRLQRLLAWIELRLSEPIGISEMAIITAQSESALFVTFQRHLGTTPMRWLGEQRLQRAHAMLGDPKNTMTLGNIAREVGFTDQSAFSRAFSRRFGHAPIALRRGSATASDGSSYQS
ncbi:AraC family transcriptional regulator [Thalassospira xiamenensis]|uniref:AraC family transcriptional regulator n=1 Tax=Thalassospira xiamenensis TaxID=220697 RepID=UPI0007A3ACD7|nr:AraC family transcriptional regulator [Thalassospira xiamenensis]KZB54588.1 AraC family transcriptional regulator [Thalassospira xiamenensis]